MVRSVPGREECLYRGYPGCDALRVSTCALPCRRQDEVFESRVCRGSRCPVGGVELRVGVVVRSVCYEDLLAWQDWSSRDEEGLYLTLRVDVVYYLSIDQMIVEGVVCIASVA